jgi:hypothetical protein
MMQMGCPRTQKVVQKMKLPTMALLHFFRSDDVAPIRGTCTGQGVGIMHQKFKCMTGQAIETQ